LQKSGVATIDSLLWRGRKSAPTDNLFQRV
jgi:hypothetical protein